MHNSSPLAQACSLCPIHNPKFSHQSHPSYQSHPSHRGCPKSFKSTITPHTLANFQSLPKFFFSAFSLHRTTAHCPPLFWRGGTGVRTPLPQACSLCPIPNPKFSHQSHPSYQSHPSHPYPPIQKS